MKAVERITIWMKVLRKAFKKLFQWIFSNGSPCICVTNLMKLLVLNTITSDLSFTVYSLTLHANLKLSSQFLHNQLTQFEQSNSENKHVELFWFALSLCLLECEFLVWNLFLFLNMKLESVFRTNLRML